MSNECEKQGTSEKPRTTNWENLKGDWGYQEVARLAQGMNGHSRPASVTQDWTFAQNRILVLRAQMDR